MTKGPYLFDEFFSSDFEESVSPYITPDSRWLAKGVQLKGAVIAAFSLICAFGLSFFLPPLSHFFLLLVYFFAGTKSLIDTIEDIKKFDINIDVLMTLAAFLSVLIDSAMEGGLLLVLFSLSGAMEDIVERKSKSALFKLHQIAPTFALALSDDGKVYEKSIKEIPTGTKLLIRPGDVIPLDSEIIKGSSFVNMVHLTGESEPLSKKEKDTLQAGSLNLDGSLIVVTLKNSAESTLSRIIKLIHHAQDTKPKVQKFLDKFSRTYAVTIICLSAFFIGILPFIFNIPFVGSEGSIYRGLAFLIAASPCAIIIATPTAYLSAISACAKKGILLKGGISLDALAKCNMVAFDKTGTLTTGNLKCSHFEKIDGNKFSDDEALSIAATLEKQANHPIAKAITEYAAHKEILLHQVDKFKSIAGFGLEALMKLNNESVDVFIGNPEYILKRGKISDEAKEKLKKKVESIHFPLCVLLLEKDLYIFTFVDEIRKNLFSDIEKLKNENLRLLMVTGDHKQSALHVGKEAGIETIYYDLRPEDKLRIISDLSKEHHLAMIGDGINDAPALAKALVGISMGQVGSDTAIDASDVVLLQDDLSLLPWTFKKSHQTLHIVKQNLTLALGVIIFATTPALLGLIPLWLAVILHEGGTVIVGLNSLRLLRR